MWRKTRQPSGPGCWGADPNRNFDSHWSQGGHSTNPCSEIFSGAFPFSEPEVRALADYYATIPNLCTFLSMHSFGQFIILPPSWTFEPTGNQEELFEIGRKAIESLTAVFGTPFRIDTGPNFFCEF